MPSSCSLLSSGASTVNATHKVILFLIIVIPIRPNIKSSDYPETNLQVYRDLFPFSKLKNLPMSGRSRERAGSRVDKYWYGDFLHQLQARRKQESATALGVASPFLPAVTWVPVKHGSVHGKNGIELEWYCSSSFLQQEREGRGVFPLSPHPWLSSNHAPASMLTLRPLPACPAPAQPLKIPSAFQRLG